MDRSRLSRFVNQRLNELPLEAPAVVSPSTSVRSALAVAAPRPRPRYKRGSATAPDTSGKSHSVATTEGVPALEAVARAAFQLARQLIDAALWGQTAPQPRSTLSDGGYPGNRPEMGEDCLVLNVWTPGADETRRPVMVWLHGGGFEARLRWSAAVQSDCTKASTSST